MMADTTLLDELDAIQWYLLQFTVSASGGEAIVAHEHIPFLHFVQSLDLVDSVLLF